MAQYPMQGVAFEESVSSKYMYLGVVYPSYEIPSLITMRLEMVNHFKANPNLRRFL